MNIKIFKLSMLNIKRNRVKNIFYMFIMGFFIIALIISTNLSYLIEEYINYNLFENESIKQVSIEIQDRSIKLNKENVINSLKKYDYVKDVILEDTDINNSNIFNIKIIVNNYEDIDKAIAELNTDLYYITNSSNYVVFYSGSTEFQQNISKNLKIILDITIIFITIITFICLNIIVKNTIDERIQEIAIYKSVGYKNKFLFLLILFESFILVTFSYLFAMLFSKIILYFVINLISSKTNIILINNNKFYQYVFPLVLVYLICICASYIALLKIKKISLKKLLIE